MYGTFSQTSLDFVQGVFDFVTCQRSDGSFYGNGGGTCKKGSESTLPQDTKVIKGKLADVVTRYSDGLRTLFPEITDQESLVRLGDEYASMVEKNKEMLKNGDFTFEQLKDYAINADEGKSFNHANFVIIGMEPGHDGADYESQFARDYATHQLKKKYGDGNYVSAIRILETQMERDAGVGKREGFILSALTNSREGLGKEEARRQNNSFAAVVQNLADSNPKDTRKWATPVATYGSSALAVNDALPFRAASTLDKGVYKVFQSQKDPKVRAVAGRREVEAIIGDRRLKGILKDFSTAVAVNPNLGGGMALPGGIKGNEERWNAYQRMARVHQNNGGKVYQGTAEWTVSKGTAKERTASVKTIAMEFSTPAGEKKFFVVPAVSANSTVNKLQQSGDNSLSYVFRQVTKKALSGQMEPFKFRSMYEDYSPRQLDKALKEARNTGDEGRIEEILGVMGGRK